MGENMATTPFERNPYYTAAKRKTTIEIFDPNFLEISPDEDAENSAPYFDPEDLEIS